MRPRPSEEFTDTLGRPLRELRVSVTDRCNFRCRYCMPREHFGSETQYVSRAEILGFEAIFRVVSLLHVHGLRKVRITGGEPLLRRDVSQLIGQLRLLPGLELTMTTNGSLLTKYAFELRHAGLDRLTVSLDALDDDIFQQMSDSPFTPADVLSGIAAAEAAGFESVKVNCVVKRGVNAGEILPLAERFRDTGHVLRFIEYMDTGETNGWVRSDVVTASEIASLLAAKYPLLPEDSASASQTAQMFRYRDGAGQVGIVASVSQPFCSGCARARLTTKGELYTCLFGRNVLDVGQLLHRGSSNDELIQAIAERWSRRADRYSELRGAHEPMPESEPTWNVPVAHLRRARVQRSEMSYLGG